MCIIVELIFCFRSIFRIFRLNHKTFDGEIRCKIPPLECFNPSKMWLQCPSDRDCDSQISILIGVYSWKSRITVKLCVHCACVRYVHTWHQLRNWHYFEQICKWSKFRIIVWNQLHVTLFQCIIKYLKLLNRNFNCYKHSI